MAKFLWAHQGCHNLLLGSLHHFNQFYESTNSLSSPKLKTTRHQILKHPFAVIFQGYCFQSSTVTLSIPIIKAWYLKSSRVAPGHLAVREEIMVRAARDYSHIVERIVNASTLHGFCNCVGSGFNPCIYDTIVLRPCPFYHLRVAYIVPSATV